MIKLQPSITVPPQGNTVKNQAKGRWAAERRCDACGVVLDITSAGAMLPGVDLWLCGECLRTLSAEAIERLASEIALRGVPWS